ncbi:hypothetical protein BRARA_I00264, partial [Brassica rapa]
MNRSRVFLKLLSSRDQLNPVATSVLSKEWRFLWKMVSKLELLLSNKAPVLERLQISFIRLCCGAVDVGIWIGIAYAHHVQTFRFPRSLYNCETLETLKLRAWVLVDVPSQACLKSLRTLHLRYVDYKDHSSFPNLLSGCPNLENLLLCHNQYYGQIFTIAVPSLRTLTIYDYNDGQDFVGYSLNCCLIENAPELVEANIDNVSKITNEKLLVSLTLAKRLSLALSPLEVRVFLAIYYIFYQLVYLELSTHKAQWRNLLLLILDSSPKLQVLKLIS